MKFKIQNSKFKIFLLRCFRFGLLFGLFEGPLLAPFPRYDEQSPTTTAKGAPRHRQPPTSARYGHTAGRLWRTHRHRILSRAGRTSGPCRTLRPCADHLCVVAFGSPLALWTVALGRQRHRGLCTAGPTAERAGRGGTHTRVVEKWGSAGALSAYSG